jgi:hypothetical protein
MGPSRSRSDEANLLCPHNHLLLVEWPSRLGRYSRYLGKLTGLATLGELVKGL